MADNPVVPSSEERIRNRQQPDDQHQGHHQPPEHQVVAVGDVQQVAGSNHQVTNNKQLLFKYIFTFAIKLFLAYFIT